jgi:hypothetical protein
LEEYHTKGRRNETKPPTGENLGRYTAHNHLGKENHSSDTYTTELKIEGEDWKSDETTQPKHNIPAVKKKYSQATSIKKCHIII